MPKSIDRATLIVAGVVFCLSAAIRDYRVAAQQTASISGRVMIKDKPAAGIPVFARSRDNLSAILQGQPSPSANTDADGHYHITGLPRGTYIVGPEVPGYIVPSDASIPFLSGKTLSLKDGEEAEDVDFSPARGGVLTGRVTYPNGQPVIASRMMLQTVDANGKKQGVMSLLFLLNPQTDDRGIFRIYGLAPGKYVISMDDPRTRTLAISGGARSGRTFYPGVTAEDQAQLIELKEGGEASDLDFTLVVQPRAQTFAASGRVIDAESGSPVPLLDMIAISIDKNNRTSFGMGGVFHSNSAGDFRVEGLLPGSYQISSASTTQSDAYIEPAGFDITASDVAGLEVKVRKGVSVSGTVVFEGVSDPAVLAKISQINLMLFPADPSTVSFTGLRQTRAAADGTFRFSGVQPGKVMLQAGGTGEFKGARLLRVEGTGTEQMRTIDVPAGEGVSGIRVVMSYGTGVIQGQINVEGGTLPPGARLMVSARRSGGSPSLAGANAEADARGRFTIENLAGGEYEVQVRAFVMTDPAASRNLPSPKQTVVVPEGGTSEVTLVIKLGGQQ